MRVFDGFCFIVDPPKKKDGCNLESKIESAFFHLDSIHTYVFCIFVVGY